MFERVNSQERGRRDFPRREAFSRPAPHRQTYVTYALLFHLLKVQCHPHTIYQDDALIE